jgi:hypothetical protein
LCDNQYQRILIRNLNVFEIDLIKLRMKAILLAFFVALAFTAAWDVVDTLPPCYTGLPFSLELGNSNALGYTYSSISLPTWAYLDSIKGAISGSSREAGAWPVSVKVSDKSGKYVSKQYILNVVDVTQNNVWVSDASSSYYNRKVVNPLRILPSKSDSTVTKKGSAFSYRFATENAVGSPVFAFLNLPDGLIGDSQTGAISGAFTVPGIYTLGIESADQSGKTA